MGTTWESQYEQVWLDFLTNKRDVCLQKLKKLLQDGTTCKNSDDVIMQADFLYIHGVLEGDAEILTKALIAYRRHEKLVGSEHNNLKMQGETLLRLHRYEEAFDNFDRLAELHISNPEIPWENREVSAAWLQHEIAQREQDGATSDVADLQQVLDGLKKRHVFVNAFGDSVSERTLRTLIQTLPADHQRILRSLPPRRPKGINSVPSTINASDVLNAHHDWDSIQAEYRSNGIVIVDDLLAPSALAALRGWATMTPSFQTQRAGFLGAFPSNGANYVLIRYIAEALEAALPDVCAGHPLGLWWLFKYAPGVGNEGIGLHADPAAVNVNIWLTDDKARVRGGGLEVFSHVPPSEARVQEFNREFDTKQEEEALIAKLKEHAWKSVEYKQNRAVFFVSDRYHRSIPFEFEAESLADWRLNFTLLFGDRPRVERHMEMSAAPPEQEGWDLF